jgi:uncharacterized protein
MTIADEVQKLQQLRQSGAISEEEFVTAKARLLGAPMGNQRAPVTPVDVEQQTRQWAMFLHLSQFAGYAVPLGGLIVPILIWQIKKAELPGIDIHGKIVVNWMISFVIYFIISLLLAFVLIGIPLLLALGVVGIVFPIIGGIKASNGEAWKYPLSIGFFS